MTLLICKHWDVDSTLVSLDWRRVAVFLFFTRILLNDSQSIILHVAVYHILRRDVGIWISSHLHLGATTLILSGNLLKTSEFAMRFFRPLWSLTLFVRAIHTWKLVIKYVKLSRRLNRADLFKSAHISQLLLIKARIFKIEQKLNFLFLIFSILNFGRVLILRIAKRKFLSLPYSLAFFHLTDL
jgi:hypothetical protein